MGNFSDGATRHGFFYDGLGFHYQTLDVLGAVGTWALDINSLGHIVGYFQRPDLSVSGFFYDGASYTILQTGAGNTYAYGLNDNDIVVGGFGGAGFVYDGGAYTTGLMVDSFPTTLYDINNSGRLVGYYFDATNHGFTALDPVATPLPPAVWLLGSSLLGLAGLRTRRRQGC